jgi:hypothetical protein
VGAKDAVEASGGPPPAAADVPSLFQVEATDRWAILFALDPAPEAGFIEYARSRAGILGWTVVRTVNPPLPEGVDPIQVLIDTARLERAKTVLVPTGFSLAAVSPESAVKKFQQLAEAGLRVLSLDPEEGFLDTIDDRFYQTLFWTTRLRKEGIRRKVKDWVQKRKASGERMGHFRACLHCGHSVVRGGRGGRGHVRMPAPNVEFPLAIGRCFAENCGCSNYSERPAAAN